MQESTAKTVSVKDNAQNKIPLTEKETYAPKEGYSRDSSKDENTQQTTEKAKENAKKENKADKLSVIGQETMNQGEIFGNAQLTKTSNLNRHKRSY
ncbi:hypothetical protein [Peptoniphilus grossensis]|uniref:Uncharacterized protein n=1 Tax=Peptoniphilus grossensis TaxID=1465756 RepID=A0ABU7X8N1_9FIRM